MCTRFAGLAANGTGTVAHAVRAADTGQPEMSVEALLDDGISVSGVQAKLSPCSNRATDSSRHQAEAFPDVRHVTRFRLRPNIRFCLNSL